MGNIRTSDATEQKLNELVAIEKKKTDRPTSINKVGVVAELINKAHRRRVKFTRVAEVELMRIDQGEG